MGRSNITDHELAAAVRLLVGVEGNDEALFVLRGGALGQPPLSDEQIQSSAAVAATPLSDDDKLRLGITKVKDRVVSYFRERWNDITAAGPAPTQDEAVVIIEDGFTMDDGDDETLTAPENIAQASE